MGSLTVPLMDAPSSGTDEQRWGRLGRAAFWGLRQVRRSYVQVTVTPS